jgi:hypothetical protein
MLEKSRDRLARTHRRIEVAPLRGRFLRADWAVRAAEALLRTYRDLDGSHEGIAFLCGSELPKATLYATVIVLDADPGRGHVQCSEAQVAAVSAAARALGLLRVQSHPGYGTTHSFGGDDMVPMPFEGMLSIGCSLHGRFALRPLETLGMH